MKLQSALLPAVLFVMLVLVGAAQAQISITSLDIIRPEGYSFANEYATGLITVDNGSPGGNMSWDFSSYVLPEYTEAEVVNVAETPFFSDFPSANYCVFYSSEEGEGGSYSYMSVLSNMWTILGNGIDIPETSFVQKYDPPGQIPLPIEYGDSWVLTTAWSDTVIFPLSVVSRSHEEVDAYGTMTIPMGDYDVLRVLAYDTVFTTTGFPPFVFTDTTATISYSWMAKDPLFIAETVSNPGETDPDFTEASFVERAAPLTGIEEEETNDLPRTFSLAQNYPNPFNPQTEITFSVKESSAKPVDLSIYSLRGTRIATLVSARLEPGIHKTIWNGKNEKGESQPSGVYFYRLTSGAESITKKMILAR